MARKVLGERRIGHTGTLDPLAEGLLLLCVGQATRLQQFLLQWDKVYQGEIRLGWATTTYDSEGEASEPRGEVPPLDRKLLDQLEERFRGEISQVPPPYSAKKIAGRKLYELARNGEIVSPEPKLVQVKDLRLAHREPDLLVVQTTTSTGFYVRSMAHDIGIALGCGGHLEHLHRSAIGPYTAADALDQEALTSAASAAEIIHGPNWVPIDDVALPFPDIEVNATAAARFAHGQDIVVFTPGIESVTPDSRIVVRSPDKRMLGIGSVRAVLARGRTLNIAPAMVLESAMAAVPHRK
jgi:tRNA pseudouridine55 synthase